MFQIMSLLVVMTTKRLFHEFVNDLAMINRKNRNNDYKGRED
jgi:hypothetical protein